jgi:hypothetical protein
VQQARGRGFRGAGGGGRFGADDGRRDQRGGQQQRGGEQSRMTRATHAVSGVWIGAFGDCSPPGRAASMAAAGPLRHDARFFRRSLRA